MGEVSESILGFISGIYNIAALISTLCVQRLFDRLKEPVDFSTSNLSAIYREIQDTKAKLEKHYKSGNITYAADNNIVLSNFTMFSKDRTKNELVEINSSPLNLSFAPGNIYKLEGKSGRGKSTLVSALGRLYHLYNGAIYLPKSYLGNRNAIQYVSQKGWHYISGTSIEEFILSGVPEENHEKAKIEAAKLFSRLGIDHAKLSSKEMAASGGEERRILLAKAILSRAKLIVVDEGLSSISNDDLKATRKLLQEYATGSYEHHKEKNIVICIVHDEKLNELPNDVKIVLGGDAPSSTLTSSYYHNNTGPRSQNL
jgi:ABC-type lipoprotein export system ATPase subunit